MLIAMNKIGRHWCRLLLVVAILSGRVNTEKQKRQIFREQVLPALGGKIPEEAFRTDRLALNRLNKEGISVPDGVVLDARHIHKHPHTDRRTPSEILKVYLTSDGRYVSPEGRSAPKTVETTYIIRRPFMHTHHKPPKNFENVKDTLRSYPKPHVYTNYRQFVPIAVPIKPGVYKPVVTPLILPSTFDTSIDEDLYDLSDWRTEYDWDTVCEPFDDDYYINNIAYFDSHQIITNYQEFLNEFHKRSLRHVASRSSDQQYRQGRNYH